MVVVPIYRRSGGYSQAACRKYQGMAAGQTLPVLLASRARYFPPRTRVAVLHRSRAAARRCKPWALRSGPHVALPRDRPGIYLPRIDPGRRRCEPWPLVENESCAPAIFPPCKLGTCCRSAHVSFLSTRVDFRCTRGPFVARRPGSRTPAAPFERTPAPEAPLRNDAHLAPVWRSSDW